LVESDAAHVFRFFSDQLDSWWPRGSRYRVAGPNRGKFVLEPRLNGRLYEQYDNQGVARVVRAGRVLEWEPPTRLVFDFRSVDCTPGELTRVEVSFEADSGNTRVNVVHRGWSALRADHPARHGLSPEAFLGSLTAWWDELLRSLRAAGART
jgi:uncharacterized protein YndB with AHSA1/START domain